MTTQSFWRDIKGGALRPADPPSWPRAALRTPVSLAVYHIPGTPDREQRQDDGKQGAGQ